MCLEYKIEIPHSTSNFLINAMTFLTESLIMLKTREKYTPATRLVTTMLDVGSAGIEDN